MIKIVLISIIVLAWFSLPYVPAFHEWRKKRDARPLNVVREYDVDVHRFANVFQAYVQDHLSEAIAVCEQSGTLQSGVLDDGTSWMVLPRDIDPMLDDDERTQQITQTLFIARGDLDLPGGMSYLAEILAIGNISGGEGDIYRAIRAHGDIDIAADSMLLRWMHADREVRVAGGSVLHGRVSADVAIRISSGAHFRRLNAPDIVFGYAVEPVTLPTDQKPVEAIRLNPKVTIAGRRWLFKGDLVIPKECLIDADIVVTGKLDIGKNVRIKGSVKSHKSMQIGEQTRIDGSVVSHQGLMLSPGVQVQGPVVSEADVTLGSRCVVGTVEHPTTVTAETIRVSDGVLAHGTVWARRDGEVLTINAAGVTT